MLMEGDATRLRAPYVDTLKTSPYALQYLHLERSVGVLSVVTCYVATLPRVSLRVPYMKRVKGPPLRSLCIDVVLIDYPQQYTPTSYPL